VSEPPPFAAFQAGARRLAEALNGRVPRIPVFAQMHEFVAAELGIPRPVFFRHPEVMVPAMLEVQARYGLDVASITYDVYNIEAAALGQAIRWTDTGMPDIDRSLPLIRDRDEVSKIATPDFDASPCCTRVIEMHTIFRQLTGLEPSLAFCAPFTLATNLRGIEQFLVDIHEAPAFARGLLDRLTDDVLAPYIAWQQRQFPAVTRASGVDATASPPIVSPTILGDWAARPILRLRELCRCEVAVVNWIGERSLRQPEEMLDLKRLVGTGVLWGQDPDVEMLGPERYKAYAERHNLGLILGIGAAFLAGGRPEEIAARVRDYVRVGTRGGRFALYLCNLGASTPGANLRAAVAAAREVCG